MKSELEINPDNITSHYIVGGLGDKFMRKWLKKLLKCKVEKLENKKEILCNQKLK